MVRKPKASRGWRISGSDGYGLDFIINHDIKYRMGDELNAEE
jgi:hypothetical protein